MFHFVLKKYQHVFTINVCLDESWYILTIHLTKARRAQQLDNLILSVHFHNWSNSCKYMVIFQFDLHFDKNNEPPPPRDVRKRFAQKIGFTICLYTLPGDVAEGQTVDVVPVERTRQLDPLQKMARGL